MAFYIKVTKKISDRLGLTTIRNRTADGNVLLWQADLNRIAGDTIFDRASAVGGVCLQPAAAKAEIDGTDTPVEVYTPESFLDKDDNTSDESKDTDTSVEGDSSNEEGGTV